MIRLALAALVSLAATPAAAQQPADWSNAITLTIELDDFDIHPGTIILYEGQPYRLYFVNSSTRSHNFAARRFFEGATIAPESAALVRDGRIELREGESALIHLIPPAADDYGARCSHLLHNVFGQVADIEVRPMPAR